MRIVTQRFRYLQPQQYLAPFTAILARADGIRTFELDTEDLRSNTAIEDPLLVDDDCEDATDTVPRLKRGMQEGDGEACVVHMTALVLPRLVRLHTFV